MSTPGGNDAEVGGTNTIQDAILKGGPSQFPITQTSTSPWQQIFLRHKKLIFIVLCAMAFVGLALGLGLGLGLGLPHSASAAGVLQPAVGLAWDYPLGFDLNTSTASSGFRFYPVDLENTDQRTIAALRAAGHTVVCYFSAGSYEGYRKDAHQFPEAALGNTLDGWPDERWLDVRDEQVRDVMAARIADARDKGCGGVDPDNIDAYENEPGFDLTEDEAIDYVTFLAGTARALGLAYGLKNGGAIVDRVVDLAQWVINEECVRYGECELYAPFARAGKPVFHVEYTEDDDATGDAEGFDEFKTSACAAGGQSGFSSIIKHEPLDDWIVTCT